jgi:hypothetical protein
MLTSVKGNLVWFKKRTQKLSWGRRKNLPEKWKHLIKLCFKKSARRLGILD